MKIADWTDQRDGESTLDYYKRLVTTAEPINPNHFAHPDSCTKATVRHELHSGGCRTKLRELLATAETTAQPHFVG